ncbi:MAG: hypothetical protein KatS3mg101_0252 [Patescibacteria group bacterium]|nr:MAG: hypothetical protein KatS3mg101_0252 [Patescibacteria group bacterium]
MLFTELIMNFGFDYLRDNMVYNLEAMVQTNPNGEFGVHNFAIVDEVDSILIDVARTPPYYFFC